MGVLLATGTAIGQSGPDNQTSKRVAMFDLGVIYSAERNNQIGGDVFGLQGGSLEAAFPLYRDFAKRSQIIRWERPLALSFLIVGPK